MPAIRYVADVGRGAAALPVPASSPSHATGGACRVIGYPGTLAVPAPGPNVLQDPRLAALGFYGSNAATYMHPNIYRIVAPYPMTPPVGRTRDRPSPVPAISTPRSAAVRMQRPARIGGLTVTANPRPIVLWPIRGRPGRFA